MVSSPLPTRREFNRVCSALTEASKKCLAEATRANKAEAEVAALQRKAGDYLEIYRKMNIELEKLRRKAADDHFNTTTFAPLEPNEREDW